MKHTVLTLYFWLFLIGFIIISAVICCFPYLFTNSDIFNFSESGQIIGNTIGGIMSPYVAICASFLTFLAFWVQYRANVLQREDMKKERFENNLFRYFQMLANQLADINLPQIGNNKQSFHFMFYEFKCICFYLQRHQISKDKDKNEVFRCAYNIFINGASMSDTKRLKDDCNKHLFSEKDIAKINKFFHNFNNNKVNKRDGEVQYLRDYKTSNIMLFDGHRLHLIPFYRSICIIVQYMYEEIFPQGEDCENDARKCYDFNFYAELLCSQLSEHQIGLLKAIYMYGCDRYRTGRGTEKFFKETINDYLTSDTMNCEKWNFLP